MPATAKPFLARLGLAIGLAGSLAVPALSLGLSDTGLYSVVTAGSEVIGFSLAGIQGPTFTRSGSAVNTVLPGSLTVTGNFTVNGTTSTVNSTVVDVSDRVIRVNKSAGADAPVPSAITGISVYRGAVASVARDHHGLFWDEAATTWKLAVNTGGDDATLGAYLNLQVLGLTAATITLGNQTANTVYAGPTSGGAATPAFRALVSADIPLTATYVGYGSGTGGLTGDSAFTRASLAVTIDPGANAVMSIGYGKLGYDGSNSTIFTMAQTSCMNSTDYGFRQSSVGVTITNAKTGQSVFNRINDVTKTTLTTSAFTFASGVPVTASDTADSTSGTSGAINTLGGVGVTKALFVGLGGTFGATLNANGSTGILVTQTAAAGGSRYCLWVVPAANTTVVAAETIQVKFNFARTQTFATSVPVTQREFSIDKPTYACDTAAQTITTAATVAITGAPVAGTNVTITTPLSLWVQTGNVSFSENTDNTFTTGYGKYGLIPGGTTGNLYIAQASNFTAGGYALRQLVAGGTIINAQNGQSLILSTNGTTRATVIATLISTATGVQFSVLDTTASTTTTSGCAIFAGGVGIVGSIFSGGITSNAAVIASSRFGCTVGTAAFIGAGQTVMAKVSGTIGTSGDMLIQSDAVGTRDFLFAAGSATAIVAKILGTGSIECTALGAGLRIKEGSSGRSGNASLTTGAVTVTCTNISATSSRVHLTRKTAGGTIGTAITYTIADGASFTINSDNPLDTSTFTYFITEAA